MYRRRWPDTLRFGTSRSCIHSTAHAGGWPVAPTSDGNSSSSNAV